MPETTTKIFNIFTYGSMTAPQSIRHTVTEDEAGMRLDRLLSQHAHDLSRSRITALIKDGAAATQTRVIREPSYTVKHGDRVELVLPEVKEATVEPEAIPLDVLHEDEDVIVFIKPVGMVVHPAPGHARGTLVNALLHHCGESLSGIGGVMRPGIVHRLDQHVSGVMVAAKNDSAHRHLAGQFTVHSIERVYRALVYGLPSPAAGSIDAPIGRHPRDRLRQAVVERGGKHAISHYRVEAAAGTQASIVDVTLETGRTHQIRVHLAHIGHPILGDPLYHGKRHKLPAEIEAEIKRESRIMLHAWRLGFEHPSSGERMQFEVSAPTMFFDILARIGG
jgi:23S rRNA pseudouridine1911/1915/1917 synthase